MRIERSSFLLNLIKNIVSLISSRIHLPAFVQLFVYFLQEIVLLDGLSLVCCIDVAIHKSCEPCLPYHNWLNCRSLISWRKTAHLVVWIYSWNHFLILDRNCKWSLLPKLCTSCERVFGFLYHCVLAGCQIHIFWKLKTVGLWCWDRWHGLRLVEEHLRWSVLWQRMAGDLVFRLVVHICWRCIT